MAEIASQVIKDRTNLVELVSKTVRLKKNGNEYVGLCPFHEDSSPSLSVNPEKKVWFCHGCGATGDCFDWIKRTRKVDFKEALRILSGGNEMESPKIIATYDYKDENGQPIYQVVRYEPKSFRQRHTGNGEWVWNMDGVRRVLYHLDALSKVQEETVYLVEGEKDADNLMSWGLIATTSPGGANNWQPEYADDLKGFKVVIIPDKDQPGYQYALKAAGSLEGKTKSISVIILPGDTVKDVSDWFDQGGDYELLKTMEQDVKTLTTLTSLTNGPTTDNADYIDKTESSDTTYKPTRGRIIWRLVDDWLEEHQGEKFDLDTICRQLDIKTRDDRHHVVKKLSHEVTHENLEKSDRLYIYINKTFKCIDWVNASSSPPLRVNFPYGIEDDSKFGFDGHAVISPGDIIVIAGVSNMGKTAWCLNFLWENMDNFPCTLMGNEYTAAKFKRRVSRMTWHNPLTDQGHSKFELIERRSDWKAVIRPNNINIIDWINLDDNFFKIGSIIEGIQSQLKEGIAVISIQKSESKGLGLGGSFSEHLASLYLTIDFERMTVRKCKEWNNHNPNGEMYKFRIVDGGTKFHDIHAVKKCKKCGGTGHFRLGDCDSCNGTGVVENI